MYRPDIVILLSVYLLNVTIQLGVYCLVVQFYLLCFHSQV